MNIEKLVRRKPDTWLWCLHCERFFQAKDLQRDEVGGKQGCKWYKECGGSGLYTDIDLWDAWPSQNDLPHWPKDVSELRDGMKCPLYPEEGI